MPSREPHWHLDRDGYRVADVNLWGRKSKMSQHRWNMAHALGRYLKAGEVVHHIDGNRSNNTIENLELRTTATHAPGQSVFALLDHAHAYIRDHEPAALRLGYTPPP